MFNYDQHFEGCIDKLKEESRYRLFREIGRHCGSFPHASFHRSGEFKEITVWCSNDYLGMGQHPQVLSAMQTALDEFGAGSGGTRNISGTHHLMVALERELADLHGKEAALVFSSGYVANETALCSLGSLLPGCVIISDSHNHASMIEGIRHSKAEKRVFKHNDVKHLEQLLSECNPRAPKLVACESLYSMDGDFSPLQDIINVCKRFGAMLYVDETHAVGVYGNRGGGVAEREGLLAQIDVLQGGLGKGFGVVGGFITGKAPVIDAVRSYGSGFIFTTSLPPVVAAGALASIRHLKESQAERTKLFQVVAATRKRLLAANLPIRIASSQIIPLMVGDSARCKQISDVLLDDHNLYLQPINYPTVPRGTERLRITPSPLHTPEHIEVLAEALTKVWKQFKIEIAA